jgi:hypothetical protein
MPKTSSQRNPGETKTIWVSRLQSKHVCNPTIFTLDNIAIVIVVIITSISIIIIIISIIIVPNASRRLFPSFSRDS